MSGNIIYGIHTIKSYLKSHHVFLKKIFCLKGRVKSKVLQDIILLGKINSVSIELVNENTFNSLLSKYISDSKVVHQNVIGIVGKNFFYSENDIVNLVNKIDKVPFILILDGIQDPHNMGACIRCANAVGIDFIIFSKNRGVGINATVEKVACGGASEIKFVSVSNLLRTIRLLKKLDIWIIGMSPEANELIYDVDLKYPIALVLGSEDKGISFSIKSECDHFLKLPMFGSIDSLNVSVSLGVSAYEINRQRYFSEKK